jgi:hypothetical protein
MNNFNKIPDTVLENALIGTSDLFNRNIIEHVCFQQRVALDICFDNRNRFVILFLKENIAKKEKKERFSALNFRLAVNMLQLIYALKKHNN